MKSEISNSRSQILSDILCGEIGAPDADRWSAPVHDLSTHDLTALESLHHQGLVELRPAAEDAALEIAGTDHVGLVVLPTGRRLQIRPKVGNLVLLDWLAWLDESPPPAQWLAGEAGFVTGTDFPSVLATLLLHELEKLTRAPLRREFVATRRASSTVRGRVLAGALAKSSHRLPTVPQAQRSRTADTLHNRVLAAALDRLPLLLPPSPETRTRLAALRDDWSEVGRDLPDLPRALSDSRFACPPAYAAATQLASLILSGGAAPSPASGAGGRAFLLSLAGVWERAVRKLCATLAPETGWKPTSDADRTKHWHDGPGLANPVRWMTADVLLQTSAGRRWVLDAKYKRDYGCEDRNDRFQATAYAMAFGAERGSLVYPTADGTTARWRVLLNSRVGRKNHVTIDSIELPMAAGPHVCRAALLELIRAHVRGSTSSSVFSDQVRTTGRSRDIGNDCIVACVPAWPRVAWSAQLTTPEERAWDASARARTPTGNSSTGATG